MNLANFIKDFKLSQRELADVLKCTPTNVSNIVNGKRNLTGLHIRLLIDKYGFEAVSKYAEPDELPANITINMPKVETNSGQINGGGGNSMNTVDASLIQALNEALKQNSKSQEQIDRLITLLEKK